MAYFNLSESFVKSSKLMAEVILGHEEKIAFLHACFQRIQLKCDSYKARFENLSLASYEKLQRFQDEVDRLEDELEKRKNAEKERDSM